MTIFKAFMNQKKIILGQTRKDKNTIYGARSIEKQIKHLARPTLDWDIYSKTPLKSARKLDSSLDRAAGPGQQYYVKPAMHPGTHKVLYVGKDGRRDTVDDIHIADYTKPNRAIAYVVINGVRYAKLSESIADKRRSLKDPQSAFRHEKDRNDLRRIQRARAWGYHR